MPMRSHIGFAEHLREHLEGLAKRLGFRFAPSRRQLEKYELRQRALRRMAEVVERSGAQRLPRMDAADGAAGYELSRYALPIGLHLDRARQVIQAARCADGSKGSRRMR